MILATAPAARMLRLFVEEPFITVNRLVGSGPFDTSRCLTPTMLACDNKVATPERRLTTSFRPYFTVRDSSVVRQVGVAPTEDHSMRESNLNVSITSHCEKVLLHIPTATLY